MDLYSAASTATTVLLFLSFLGIVAWAYSRRRAAAFEEAANAPFALPDDLGTDGVTGNRAESKSAARPRGTPARAGRSQGPKGASASGGGGRPQSATRNVRCGGGRARPLLGRGGALPAQRASVGEENK